MYHVIVYGISGTLELNEDYIEKRFKVVGYSEIGRASCRERV